MGSEGTELRGLEKDFNHGLVAILQKGKRKVPVDSANTEEETNEDMRAPKYQKISHSHENPAEKDEFPSLPDRRTRVKIMALVTKQLKEESEENMPFSISLWDLGGQDEFIFHPPSLP